MIEYLLPTRIVTYQGINNVESIFKPKGLYGLHDGDASLWDKKYAKMVGQGSSITLDFGKEMNGGVRILSGWIGNGDCKVRIRFGESLSEVNSEIGEKNSCNVHCPRDFEAILCASGDSTFGQTGFRFVRIDVLGTNWILLRNIYCENHILKRKTKYEYRGKDPLIRDIFLTAKRTVDLCAGSGRIWDGVKRDRLVWVGDLAPEIMALSTMYGPTPEVERSLNDSRLSFPLPYYINNIATYSMWWLINLGDYHREFGRDAFIKKQMPYANRLIKQLSTLVDENGTLVSDDDIRFFVDWPTEDTPDRIYGVYAIFLMSMKSAIEDLPLSEEAIETAKSIRERLLKFKLEPKKMKQIIALKYFATGELTDEDYKKLIEGGAKGFSTFMSYYILSTIASRDEALSICLMKEYYGAMLDKGATSFFEDFDMDWVEGSGRIDEIDPNKKDLHGDYGKYCYLGFRHSLCHGWSAGVIRFIQEHCR